MNFLPKKILLGFLLVLIVSLLLYYIFKLIEPSSLPQNVFTSNITDHQATVSWTTQKPTKGILVISEDGKFPLLPFLAKKIYRDDGENSLKTTNFYTSHYITADNLAPQKTYHFLIYQGWKKQVKGSFATGPALKSINTPNPVYGRILTPDKKAAIGAIVYFQASNSAVLSTLTNDKGRWTIDLANLRTADLKNAYQVSEKTKERIIVEAGSIGRVKAETTSKYDNPWPDVILK